MWIRSRRLGGIMLEQQAHTTKLRSLLIAAVVVLLLGSAVALAANDGGADGTANPSDEPAAADGGVANAAASSEAPVGAPSTEAPAGGAAKANGAGDAGEKGSAESSGASSDASSTPSTTPTTASPDSGDYRYEVTVTPCVKMGESFTVTFRLRPGHGGSFIVAYADGSSHGTQRYGLAGDDGLLTWTEPAAGAAGPAFMLTQATNEQGKTGRTRLEFRVVEPTGKC